MKLFISALIAVVLLVSMYSGRYYMGFVDLAPDVVNSRYANDESKFIALGSLQKGIEVHYRDEGLNAEENPDAPVLFLLHGIMASLHTWDGWVENLQDDFRIIRVDIPGFGLTGPYADGIYNVERAVDMLNQLSSELKIESFSLAGNSMGGLISWNFAVQYPEKVERLILLDSAGYSFDLPVMLKLLRTPILKDSMAFVTPKFIVTQTLSEVYGDDSKVTDETIERYHQLMLREGNRTAVVSVLESISDVENDKIKQLKVPTLIQWGEADNWIPLAHAENFAAEIEGAKLITYPGVGHIPMEEIPQQSANDAKDFLLYVIEEPQNIEPMQVTPVTL
ncbi:MAG: alpha/beta hydrolase [Oleispira antarctica]|uniref:Alpha/beta hydrolase fold n=1 Tax=Oleispira antarctica RB-8 TaxID=698738 RepID=R4YPV5_OLEAN|nr:alpha/beta hydrolase [Oleispira antarctica]MBQ0792472.1 alpha/beta hydrolase [Oleispira antarctica]CCK77112.1 Alpha/beta hydrolase fold [Oleispira antarctica RB-8]